MSNVQLQSLTLEQEEVVFNKSNILLTAIPGSGKTRVITNKLVNDVLNSSSKEKFVAITYTRRAAEEMSKRVNNVFDEFPKNVWIGTIHKFCLEFILRKFASFSDILSKGFTVLGEQDMDEIRKAVKMEIGIPTNHIFNWGIDKYGKPLVLNELHYMAVELYYKKLLKIKKIDFDFILFESYNLLKDYPTIRANLFNQINTFYIDEYQDTHDRQYDILSQIVNHSKSKTINILLAGDSNQAIYSALGGVAKTLSEVESIFNTSFLEKHLTFCFRSHQLVIEFYKKFAVQDFHMISKQVNYSNPECNIITDIHKDDVNDMIILIVRKLLEDGYDETDICIVAPQWHLLYSLSNAIRKSLPDVKLDSPAIIPLKKDEDSIIFQLSKIILTELSPSNIKRLKYHVKELIKLMNFEYNMEFPYTRINDILNIVREEKDVYSGIVEGTDYLEKVLNSVFNRLEINDNMLDSVADFIEGTRKRISRYEKDGIVDDRIFFEKSLRSKEGIVVTTAHSVKGEEYRAIISFGMLKGMIPHWNNIMDNTKSREEVDNMGKRLMFVIASRAKEKVYFIAESGRTTGTGYPYSPNRFLL